MAKLPTTYIDTTVIKKAVGSAVSNIIGLNIQATNQWSFYSPSQPKANAITKLIENSVDVTPWKEGDYRGYDHEAVAAESGGNRSYDLYEGTHNGASDTIPFEFQPEFKELNFKRLNQNINSIIIQLYDDSGYSSPIGSPTVHTIVEAVMLPTPPEGHSVQQTKIISSVSNTNWPIVTLTNPWSYYPTVYAEIFLSNAAVDGDYGHTADYKVEVSLSKILKPRVSQGIRVNSSGDIDFDNFDVAFSEGNMSDQDTVFNFTANAFKQNGSGIGGFDFIDGEFKVTYTFASNEIIIHSSVQTGGAEADIIVTGNLYNAGNGTDKLVWGDLRSVHFELISVINWASNVQTMPYASVSPPWPV